MKSRLNKVSISSLILAAGILSPSLVSPIVGALNVDTAKATEKHLTLKPNDYFVYEPLDSKQLGYKPIDLFVHKL